MIIFKDMVEKCQQLLPKDEKFEGILVVEFDLNQSTEKDIDNSFLWTCVLATSMDNNFRHYKFTKQPEKEVTYEESEMPFGYTPFQSIELDLQAALDLVHKENSETCKKGRLYFPLSPFDTEPLWVFAFDNRKNIFVGANSGKMELVN